ncbi:listerin E3 ubiquitin protein ligase 1 [Tritrichomonas musculus]|uniref:E3 ubiquitin-protein ligase listerin n=1 Tax=Tritrichomonas musculus TaxID=1915356 RepID=A0ABR2L657_9EUKA
MDLSHRIPFPDLNTFQNYFTNQNASILYNDCRSKNNKRVSCALEQLTTLIPQFNEAENYASFALARSTMQSASQKTRLDSLHLLLALSKTSLCSHIIPYILLLTHDDYPQVKAEASSNLTKLLKEIGGLRQCLPQLIPAIGSMGHIAFTGANSTNVDEVMSKSRLASCSVLAGTQLFSLLSKDINRSSSAELIQYIKIAINGVRNALNNPESSEILFYNQRLRCCLYRLQQETEKIKGCPRFIFDDFLKEKDPQCLKYVFTLIKTAENIEWPRLVENPMLLNNFIDDFIKNTSNEELSKAFHLLDEKNVLLVVDYFSKAKNLDLIDYNYIVTIPQIWEKLSDEILRRAITADTVVDAHYIIKFSSYFQSSNQIALSSPSEEASEAFLLIGKPDEIPKFIQNFPRSIIMTIQKWTRSPKTDWYVSALNLKQATIEDADTISEIIPEDKKEEFTNLVNQIITEKLQKDEEVSPSLWRYTELNDEICQLIIQKEVQINTDESTKQKHYQKIINFVENSQSESNAGTIIGKISSTVKIDNFPNTHSYDFLESFFNEYQINDAPVNIEIEFLNEYLAKEFPNFEITFYMGTFTLERTIESVSQFLSNLTHEKREEVLKTSIDMKLYQVALFLIATTKEALKVPKIEFLAPFLIQVPSYSSWIDSFCNDEKSQFVQFLKNPEDRSLMIYKDHPFFLFASATSHLYEPTYIYEAAESMINSASSLYFFLILKSLTNVDIVIPKYPEMLLSVLSTIASLPTPNSLILSALEDFFCLSAKLDNQQLFDLLSKCSFNLTSKIVSCLKKASLLYLEKIDYKEWPILRQSLSKGPVSSLNVLDESIATKIDINESEKFSFLIENFPNAAAKWFLLIGKDEKIKEKVSQTFSVKFIPILIQSTVQSVNSNEIEVVSDEKERTIKCEFVKDDDSFHLQVKIPDDYPLELPRIEIPSIGKDSVTRETRDEVVREALRPNGLTCAILTWKARIQSIVDNVNPCPICLSLLDERGDLPKAKCPTCHQCCHASCMKQWMSNSVKKICPWCRALWKVQRHRSKNRSLSSSSLGSSSSVDSI